MATPTGPNNTKVCFVIAPIGEPESEIRKRSDQVLRHVIRPAAESRGYKAIRADEIADPGLITSQVIQHIVDDPLVIADLTGWNPNVFYELAIRHAIKKPLVQVIKKGDKIPFDVAGMRTVSVDHKDLDSVDEAVHQIEEQIEALERKPDSLETPITVALQLQALRASGDPEQRSLAEVISELTEIRKAVLMLEASLHDPQRLLPPSYLREMMRRPMRGPVSEELEFLLQEMEHRLLQGEDDLKSDDFASLASLASRARMLNREARR